MNKFFMKFTTILILIVSVFAFLSFAYMFIKARTLIETFIMLLFMIVAAFATYISFQILLKSKGD